MAKVLRVQNLTIQQEINDKSVTVVDNVSFRIPKAKTVVFVGESHSGKSLIPQAILGLLPQDYKITSGEILFLDPESEGHFADLVKFRKDGLDFQAIRSGRISMVCTDVLSSLYPFSTVGDQIKEILLTHGRLGDRMDAVVSQVPKMDNKSARNVVLQVLHLVGFEHPQEVYVSFPSRLSFEECYRVMLAIGLVCRPALLIIDQLSSALTSLEKVNILHLIKDLQSQLQMSVLFVTSDVGLAVAMGDEVIVMKGGQIIEYGLCKDIFTDPQHPYLKTLCNSVPAISPQKTLRLGPIRLVQEDIDGVIADDSPGSDLGQPHVLVQFDHVTSTPTPSFAFSLNHDVYPPDHHTAIYNTSLDILSRGCFGIVHDDKKRSSLIIKLILGEVAPTSGKILVNLEGEMKNIQSLSRPQIKKYRQSVRVIFKDFHKDLNPSMTLRDILYEPVHIHGLKMSKQQESLKRINTLLHFVGLNSVNLEGKPEALTPGQKLRICLVRALVIPPRLLIFDDPVECLDVSDHLHILLIIKDLQQRMKLTVLFISDDLALLNYLVDRVSITYKGHVLEEANKADIFQDPFHPYTKALMQSVLSPREFAARDLRLLKSETSADSSRWERPFNFVPGQQLTPRQVKGDHYVFINSQSAKPTDDQAPTTEEKACLKTEYTDHKVRV